MFMKNDLNFFNSIISCCENIENYLQGIDNFDMFITDKKTIETCVFNLLQIGEFASKFSNEFCKK